MTMAMISPTDAPLPTSRRTLTEIVSAMLDALDNADGEVTAAVDELDLELTEKAQAYRAVMLQLESEGKAFEELAASYRARAEQRDNQVTGLKMRLDQALRAMKVEKLKTPTTTVYYQRSTRVEIANEETFVESAEDRFVTVKTYAAKDAIKKALESGEQVEGARLLESKHLRFR